jgi:hypothetical protein
VKSDEPDEPDEEEGDQRVGASEGAGKTRKGAFQS